MVVPAFIFLKKVIPLGKQHPQHIEQRTLSPNKERENWKRIARAFYKKKVYKKMRLKYVSFCWPKVDIATLLH